MIILPLLLSIALFIFGIKKDNKILKIISIFLFIISILFFTSTTFLPFGVNKQNQKQVTSTRSNTNLQEKPDNENKLIEGIDFIETKNYANKKLSFYYYIPHGAPEKIKGIDTLLILVPPLSGDGKNFTTDEFKRFANDNNFMIIAPSFKWDEKNWNSQTSYQYPDAWSGQALENIINKIKKDYDLNLSKYYLFGFSAGSQFALRFCVLKPELCTACASHGSGGTVLPNKKIDTKFFVTVGKSDSTRIEKSKIFCEVAQKYKIKATYKEYNQGHSLSQDQMNDSIKFFKKLN